MVGKSAATVGNQRFRAAHAPRLTGSENGDRKHVRLGMLRIRGSSVGGDNSNGTAEWDDYTSGHRSRLLTLHSGGFGGRHGFMRQVCRIAANGDEFGGDAHGDLFWSQRADFQAHGSMHMLEFRG